MNEIDVMLVVFITGGSAFFGGRYYERKKAMVAFHNFADSALATTNAITNAILGVVLKRIPEVKDELIQEIVNAMAAHGLHGAKAINLETKQVVTANDDNKAG